MNALRLYSRYAAISLRAQLEYRASLVMYTVGQFLVTGFEFLALLALFSRFGQIRGWTLQEVAFFYGLVSITFAVADALSQGFHVFGNTVKYGEFDRILLRPRSTILQLFGHEVTLRRLGRLAQGVAVMLFALAELDVAWSIGRVALVIVTIPSGVCLFVGLMVMQATTAFWTTESLEGWNAFTYGGVTMSQYPMTIYRPWFRQFFTFVIPLACINYLPGVAVLGRPDPLGTPVLVQWLSPLAGPVFLMTSLQLWTIGVRHYQSTGS